MTLHDDRSLIVVPEAWWKRLRTPLILALPRSTVDHDHAVSSLIIQQQVNYQHPSPSCRGQGEFDLVWTHFWLADDTDEMQTQPSALICLARRALSVPTMAR
jgi:hypothetical protein